MASRKKGENCMIRRTRSLAATVGALGAIALLSLVGTAIGAASKGKTDSGTSYVAITHSAGGFEYTAGNNTDKILGVGAITYKLKLAPTTAGVYKVTANPVVAYSSTGSLTGTGSATLTVAKSGAATITGGKLNLTKGTGSQKGHSLVATFKGNSTSASTYKFTYKGTYK
jgi:hypothetical protein